jgi:hypothetical protein
MGDRSGTLYHCSTCGETFTSVDSCPGCEVASSSRPSWTLTADGWRQRRIDGTTWRMDPEVEGLLIPMNPQRRPAGVVATCAAGHRYRLDNGVACPACEAVGTRPHQSTIESPAVQSQRLKPSRPLRSAITYLVIGVVVLLAGLALNANNGSLIEQTPDTTSVSPPATTGPAPTTTLTRASTTSFEPSLGWIVGACVDFIGELAEPVSCSRSHDARIVDLVTTEASCPSRTEWIVELDDDVACLVET